MGFLKGRPAPVLAAVLLLQAAAYYALASRAETAPDIAPLTAFPASSSGWTSESEYALDAETAAVLKADDTLSRFYVNRERGAGASLFIAFFKTQRHGQSPHSPKNCLPGAGWLPLDESRLEVAVPGRPAPIEVNRYLLAHGNQQSLVLYWYQSHGRVIAGEYAARLWLVADAIRYRRSDTALVRIVVPVQTGAGDAENIAINFVQSVYPDIARHLQQ